MEKLFPDRITAYPATSRDTPCAGEATVTKILVTQLTANPERNSQHAANYTLPILHYSESALIFCSRRGVLFFSCAAMIAFGSVVNFDCERTNERDHKNSDAPFVSKIATRTVKPCTMERKKRKRRKLSNEIDIWSGLFLVQNVAEALDVVAAQWLDGGQNLLV